MWVDGLPGMNSNSTLKLDKQIFKAFVNYLGCCGILHIGPKEPK